MSLGLLLDEINSSFGAKVKVHAFVDLVIPVRNGWLADTYVKSDRIHFSWSGCQVLFHRVRSVSRNGTGSLQNQRENISACASLIETLNLYRDAITA